MSNYESRLETNNTNLNNITTIIENLPDRLDTSDATAVSEDIVQGKTAYVNGQKITGTRQILPYIELEYLQSTGTQFLVTDYYPNGNSCYELEYTGMSSNGVVFGAYDSEWETGNGYYTNAIHSGGKDWFQYLSNTSTNRNSTANAKIEINKGVVKINDITYLSLEDKTFNVSRPMYIFAGNKGGGIEQRVSCKLKYFMIKENNEVLHYYIPVKRIDGAVVCMYDLITKTYLMNAGTGTFVGGEPKI